MYMPNYKKDDPKGECFLESIERLKYRIERFLIMPKHELWLQREAFVRNAYSSTMIEDATISEHEAEEAVKTAPLSGISKDRPDVANYATALSFVDYLSETDNQVDEAAVRYLHWLLMKGNDKSFPGKYRTIPNWIEDTGVRVYEPASHLDVPPLMRDLSVWLQTDDSHVHPVIKAGLAHLQLVAIHPFVDGNGRTARLLATLLLQRSGYGFRRLLSLDAYYQRNRDEYIQALRDSVGAVFAGSYDATHWLRVFLQSISVRASLLEARLTNWRIAVDKVHRMLTGTGLSERQIDGLVYAMNSGAITRKDYAEITNVSDLTATRDLAEIVRLGFLKPEGAARARRYLFVKPEEREATRAEGLQ